MDPTAQMPHTPAEYAWARQRPMEHHTPIPQVGDEVFYRHVEWGPVVRADVLDVQSLDDMSDPHLWIVETAHGEPLTLDGRHIIRPALDRWPLLTLRTPHGVGLTREARLRGSAGWLPLDWESRYRPTPVAVMAR